MIIRKAKSTDFSELCILLKQLTVVETPSINTFNTINKTNNIDIYVGIIEESIVCTATVIIEQKIIHNGSKVGHIEDVVVDSKYRSRGIGKKIISYCVEKIKENNCYKAILDCDEKNIGFYEKNGFKQKGVMMRLDI